MTINELTQLTDQELLIESKKMKSSSMMSALVIGVMVGVVVWSVAKNTVGLFTLVPLYFVYKVIKGSKNHDALKKQLEERNL